MLQVVDIENYLLKNTLIAQEIIVRIDTWDCIKLNSFGTAEKQTFTVCSEKMATEWEIDEKSEKNEILILSKSRTQKKC